jgi:hypothetical protein
VRVPILVFTSRPPGPANPQSPIPRPLCITWALTMVAIALVVGWLAVQKATTDTTLARGTPIGRAAPAMAQAATGPN